MSRVLEDGRFIEELCRKVLRYYSFEGDAVLDPFAGSGTFGRAARKMGRIPVLCEISEDYADIIEGEIGWYYDVRGRSSKKRAQQIIMWKYRDEVINALNSVFLTYA